MSQEDRYGKDQLCARTIQNLGYLDGLEEVARKLAPDGELGPLDPKVMEHYVAMLAKLDRPEREEG